VSQRDADGDTRVEERRAPFPTREETTERRTQGETPTVKRIFGTPPAGSPELAEWPISKSAVKEWPPRPSREAPEPQPKPAKRRFTRPGARPPTTRAAAAVAAPAAPAGGAAAPATEPPGGAAAPGAPAARPAPEAPGAPLPASAERARAAPPPAAPGLRSRSLPLGPALLVIGLLALAAGAALLFTSSDGDGENIVPAVGVADVTAPDGWDAGGLAPPGFGPGAATVAPDGGRGALTVGPVTPSATALLPAALVRALAEPPPRPTIAERSDAWIFSYRGMRLRGSAEPITAHVILTDRGAVAAACRGSGPDARACDEAARTLRPADGVRARRGLSAEYAQALTAAIAGLGEDRGTADPAALARRHASAADDVRAIAAVRTRPELSAANRRIAAALDRTADVYERMAAAAATGDTVAFGTARGEVVRRERALRAALDGLAGLGYRPTKLR
jgi:hypothetical protein